jgi:hypothetical protein
MKITNKLENNIIIFNVYINDSLKILKYSPKNENHFDFCISFLVM